MVTTEAKAHLQDTGYTTNIQIRQHNLIADEPLEEGGNDTGATPMELLAGALASCTTITLRMYLNRKAWEVQELSVHVKIEKDETTQQQRILRTIELVGTIPQEQKERILLVAQKCPVHKVLEQQLHIETTLN